MPRRFPLAALLVIGTLVPAHADHKSDCMGHKDQKVRIKGCSEIISANPADAAAYYNRAAAHSASGESDRAIADYTKAIELNPAYTTAYEGRAMVYAGKGDYARAVADATRAAEMKKEAIAKPPAPQAKLPNSNMNVRATGPDKAVTSPLQSKSLSTASKPEELPYWALTIGGQL